MTNQEIVDCIEAALPSLPTSVKEKILDAVWKILNDHLGYDLGVVKRKR